MDYSTDNIHNAQLVWDYSDLCLLHITLQAHVKTDYYFGHVRHSLQRDKFSKVFSLKCNCLFKKVVLINNNKIRHNQMCLFDDSKVFQISVPKIV